jgi:hypothetical protein
VPVEQPSFDLSLWRFSLTVFGLATPRAHASGVLSLGVRFGLRLRKLDERSGELLEVGRVAPDAANPKSPLLAVSFPLFSH